MLQHFKIYISEIFFPLSLSFYYFSVLHSGETLHKFSESKRIKLPKICNYSDIALNISLISWMIRFSNIPFDSELSKFELGCRVKTVPTRKSFKFGGLHHPSHPSSEPFNRRNHLGPYEKTAGLAHEKPTGALKIFLLKIFLLQRFELIKWFASHLPLLPEYACKCVFL